MADGNGVWKWIATGLTGVVVGGGSAVLAGEHEHTDNPTVSEVKEIVATAPPIVVLQQDVKHIKDDIKEIKDTNKEILDAVKALGD